MRKILVDWMIDVGAHFRLGGRTVHLAVTYLDRFLSKLDNIEKNHFQLLGVSCLKLADAYNEKSREFWRLTVSEDYANMTSGAFSKDLVVAMEKSVARVINYQIDSCTSCEMVHELLHRNDRALTFIAEYLSDLSLLDS